MGRLPFDPLVQMTEFALATMCAVLVVWSHGLRSPSDGPIGRGMAFLAMNVVRLLASLGLSNIPGLQGLLQCIVIIGYFWHLQLLIGAFAQRLDRPSAEGMFADVAITIANSCFTWAWLALCNYRSRRESGPDIGEGATIRERSRAGGRRGAAAVHAGAGALRARAGRRFRGASLRHLPREPAARVHSGQAALRPRLPQRLHSDVAAQRQQARTVSHALHGDGRPGDRQRMAHSAADA